jgi:hypothetical protein
MKNDEAFFFVMHVSSFFSLQYQLPWFDSYVICNM